MHQTRFIDVALGIVFLYLTVLVSCSSKTPSDVSGRLMKGQPVSVTFDGPQPEEHNSSNPHEEYRLIVTFAHEQSGAKVLVEGSLAEDVQGTETGASIGRKWNALFTPYEVGKWSYFASFKTAVDTTIEFDSDTGKAVSLDGVTGSFLITEMDRPSSDHAGEAMARDAGDH